MLKFNNYPPERAGDVELGAAGTRYDMELVRDGNHVLFDAGSNYGFTFLGIMASHSVSEPRIASDTIAATPEDTLEIIKPVIDQVGELADSGRAIRFARGVFHGLRVDFPDLRDIDDGEQHKLFQTLIGVEALESSRCSIASAASSLTPLINV